MPLLGLLLAHPARPKLLCHLKVLAVYYFRGKIITYFKKSVGGGKIVLKVFINGKNGVFVQ